MYMRLHACACVCERVCVCVRACVYARVCLRDLGIPYAHTLIFNWQLLSTIWKAVYASKFPGDAPGDANNNNNGGSQLGVPQGDDIKEYVYSNSYSLCA